MRIAEGHTTALTVRHPKVDSEVPVAAAPAMITAVVPAAPPQPQMKRHGTPDAAFVMQLIAAAATRTADSDASRPASDAVNAAYGDRPRAAQQLSPGRRIARSI